MTGLEDLPRREPKPGQRLCDQSTHRVRAWLAKARENGGAYAPRGWYRDYTISNLSAELARRRGA